LGEESEVWEIGDVAFYGTSLRYVRIPASVKFIDRDCFGRCTLLSHVVFEGECEVEELGLGAFSGINLESISVPFVPVKTPESGCDLKSLRRVIHWEWMREREGKPTVILVRKSEHDIVSTSRDLGSTSAGSPPSVARLLDMTAKRQKLVRPVRTIKTKK
jgi:hypothetical protein